MKFASNKDIRFLCFIDFRVIFIHAALGVYIFSKRYPFDFFPPRFFFSFLFFFMRQIITRLYCGLKSKIFYQYKRVKKKEERKTDKNLLCIYIYISLYIQLPRTESITYFPFATNSSFFIYKFSYLS